MGESVVLTGMVLTSMPVNDFDKRITILTRERGKITAFARGAKRPQSQLLAVTNPFSFGEFELFEGKSAYNLSKATIKNYFRELTLDVDTVYMGFYFLEFAEYYGQENSDASELLKLLYQSLRALENRKIYDIRLVRCIFELRALAIEGEGPNTFSCMKCRKKEKLVAFSVKRGGMLCDSCAMPGVDRPISESCRYAMQYIVSSRIEKLYSFKLSDSVLEELIHIMEDYCAFYVRHKFNSLQIMKEQF